MESIKFSERLFYDKRHKRHRSGFLDSVGQGSLMAGTSPVSFGRVNFSLRIHKPPDKIRVLKINPIHFAFAKKTLLLFKFGWIVI